MPSWRLSGWRKGCLRITRAEKQGFQQEGVDTGSYINNVEIWWGTRVRWRRQAAGPIDWNIYAGGHILHKAESALVTQMNLQWREGVYDQCAHWRSYP
jgi:hypothetical protein